MRARDGYRGQGQFLGRTPVPGAPVVDSFPVLTGRPAICEWFAGHAREGRTAVAYTWHPILGWVPVCAWCVDFVTREFSRE